MAHQTMLCPLPGAFYRSPAPGEPAFKNEGDIVKVGDVIGLIEVMKQFLEVQSEFAGRIVKFDVENDSPLEPGSPLVEIDVG